MDWLTATKHSFVTKVSSLDQLNMGVAQFKSFVLAWWRALINQWLQLREPLIEDWTVMKQEMRNVFLPNALVLKNILITDVFDDAIDEEDMFVEDFVILEDLDDK